MLIIWVLWLLTFNKQAELTIVDNHCGHSLIGFSIAKKSAG